MDIHAPRFFRSPDTGRPVSLWDREYGSVPSGYRAVPGPDGALVVASIASLYADDQRLRGRPLKFDLQTAQAIKDAYWSGRKTIAQMARETDSSELTISRLVHAKTYWYLT